MHRPFITATFLYLICVGCETAASTGVVRGGEHDGFTRLTITFSDQVTIQGYEDHGPGEYALQATPTVAKLETSAMFTRLNAGRVKAFSLHDGVPILEFDCDCRLDISNVSSNFAVIDIFEVPSRQMVTPVISKTGTVNSSAIGSPVRWNNESLALPSAFELDHSIVLRVMKQISDQINLSGAAFTTSQQNIPNGEGLRNEELTGQNRTTMDIEKAAHVEARCRDLDAIWKKIIAASDERLKTPNRGEMENVDFAEDDVDMRSHVLNLIQLGLTPEAKYLSTLEANRDFRDGQVVDLISIVNGDQSAVDLSVDPGCNPFSALVHFAASELTSQEVTDEQNLELYRTFDALPVGLQMALFDRMEPILSRVSTVSFPELRAQRERERLLVASLADRKGAVPEVASAAPDADMLGAVAKELRGTDYEQASALASFTAYLENRRYFDALAALDTLTSVPTEKRSELFSGLMSAVAKDADSITFLEVAFDQIGSGEFDLDEEAVEALMVRLTAEGFPSKSIDLYISQSAYHSDKNIRLAASRAYLAIGNPNEVLMVLGNRAEPEATAIRAAALAMLKQHSEAAKLLTDEDGSDDRLRLAWLGGQFDSLVGEDTKFASIAELLTDVEEPQDAPVSVMSAQTRLEASQALRTRLAELVRND